MSKQIDNVKIHNHIVRNIVSQINISTQVYWNTIHNNLHGVIYGVCSEGSSISMMIYRIPKKVIK